MRYKFKPIPKVPERWNVERINEDIEYPGTIAKISHFFAIPIEYLKLQSILQSNETTICKK